jgi:hypothetical protein
MSHLYLPRRGEILNNKENTYGLFTSLFTSSIQGKYILEIISGLGFLVDYALNK